MSGVLLNNTKTVNSTQSFAESFFSSLTTQTTSQSSLNILEPEMKQLVLKMTENALSGQNEALTIFHKFLATLNKIRFSVDSNLTPAKELKIDAARVYMETAWINFQKAKISKALHSIPSDPQEFMVWFEGLEQSGFGQHHPLFEFLESDATRQDFYYFLKQELATEAGFDDLVALTQVQAPHEVKLELARNYWDEMGNGSYEKMHSVLLSHVSESLEISWDEDFTGIHWQSLALANLMMAFASHRSYFNQSVGALGVIELTAPGRSKKVTDGLKRLGLSNYEYRYYSLHSVLDIKHWNGWKANAMIPLMTENPERCKGLGEGALLRLLAGAECFEIYQSDLMRTEPCSSMKSSESVLQPS